MSIAVVEKSFLLLEYMAATTRPVSLGQVAEACDLPKPSAYRILGTLKKMGYISRPPGSRDYQTGPRCALLNVANPYASLKSSAQPFMRKLYDKFGETVNLGVISDRQVIYLDYLETSQPLRMIVAPGQSDPFYCTALGCAIASQWPKETLKSIIEETDILRHTPHSVKTRIQLLEKIRRARESGYSEETGEAVEGVGCLAVNLAPLGHPGAAISVAIPLQRLAQGRKREIIACLKTLFSKKIRTGVSPRQVAPKQSAA